MSKDEVPLDEKKDALSEHSKSASKKNPSKKKKSKLNFWALKVLFLTLILSFSFSLFSQIMLTGTNLVVAYIIIIAFIIVSIIFDVIAVATTSCDIEPFLAMSARKIKGAKMAVKLIKNADKVSSVCGDIIGDICSVISGACATAIVIMQFQNIDITGFTGILVNVGFASIVATLTITGKAVGKAYAINQSHKVVFGVARILSVFSKK